MNIDEATMKCFWIFFHDWSIWEDITLVKTDYTFDIKLPRYKIQTEIGGQKRYCKKCGEQQIREV